MYQQALGTSFHGSVTQCGPGMGHYLYTEDYDGG
jgi:hypothetical protein